MQAQAKDPRRNAELAKIHIAKKQLALDDDAYRDAVRRASRGRCDSAGELKPTERGVLLDIFKKAGFKDGRPSKAVRRSASARPQAAKIRALWNSLWLLAEVESRGDKAIDAFCKRQAGVEALAWLTPAQANQVIEALKAWCVRVGFEVTETHGPGDLDAKRALVEAIWRRLDPTTKRAPSLDYSAAQLDAAAERLGSALRTTKGLPA